MTAGHEPIQVLRGVLPESAITRLRAEVEGIHETRGWGDHRYVHAADSFGIEALAGGLEALVDPLRGGIEQALGAPARRVDALCWVRRQHPPAQRPEGMYAHTWHQDGACGYDFAAGQPSTGLLELITAWIPLTACGSQAPGLEFVLGHPPGLCPLEGLGDPHPTLRRWVPALQTGDAVLFPGWVLHRTHVHAAMELARLSLELRFVPR